MNIFISPFVQTKKIHEISNPEIKKFQTKNNRNCFESNSSNFQENRKGQKMFKVVWTRRDKNPNDPLNEKATKSLISTIASQRGNVQTRNEIN